MGTYNTKKLFVHSRASPRPFSSLALVSPFFPPTVSKGQIISEGNFVVWNIPKQQRNFCPKWSHQKNKVNLLYQIQLNKYETDPYFLQIFQSSTSVCLIISAFCKSSQQTHLWTWNCSKNPNTAMGCQQCLPLSII